MNTLDDVLNALINLGYKVSYTLETCIIKLDRKSVMCMRVEDLKEDKKEFSELEKIRTEHLRFYIINDLCGIKEIDRPNGQKLIKIINELDV